ncbi:MAG: TraR/DksA family transcriptional regulator [Nitrospinales bacterium]|nr:TraR/DksA family transcriptional regulator [Nitrospinales bacterium]
MAMKKSKVKKKASKKKAPAKKKLVKKKVAKKKAVKKKVAKKKVAKKKSPGKKGPPKKATKKKAPVKKKISKTASKKSQSKKTPAKSKLPKKASTKKAKQNPTVKKKSAPKKNKLQALPKLGPETLKIKERLLGKRSELLNLIQSSKSLERDVGDLTFSNEIDLASSLEGREMIFQLTSRDRNELRLIEDALFRINEGTYGACESCEKKISLKRLQIMPLTALCIDCQEASENL